MREQILTLRGQGKSYKDIAEELQIPYRRVEYYCNPNISKIQLASRRKHAARNRIFKKVVNFHRNSRINVGSNFTFKQFLETCGDKPRCYISNTEIDLNDGPSYAIDHVIPVAQNGDNGLANARLIRADVNRMKSDKTPQELFALCREVLEANGYKVSVGTENVHEG